MVGATEVEGRERPFAHSAETVGERDPDATVGRRLEGGEEHLSA
jgi:hypothetical protein